MQVRMVPYPDGLEHWTGRDWADYHNEVYEALDQFKQGTAGGTEILCRKLMDKLAKGDRLQQHIDQQLAIPGEGKYILRTVLEILANLFNHGAKIKDIRLGREDDVVSVTVDLDCSQVEENLSEQKDPKGRTMTISVRVSVVDADLEFERALEKVVEEGEDG